MSALHPKPPGARPDSKTKRYPFKKNSGKPAAALVAPPPRSPADNKRTFDARPKPSDSHRREDSVRPTHHIDTSRSDPFDKPDSD